ncbi:helix-turn-helix domain-containing protein [Hymenobacter busanensis]|uniref:Helix-turn-helix domain-containing protein n=1 Tax=Hymenobacter busanensis TaxID=2607656 RepID=A0A7L4ZUJ2_9BACT|nr:helix-turn-helix domain-containing protein [Hymenobacter busanensis]KAA9339578.1 helix-turn-helix domain-containing protein [Hymenobacter busanensis]QHJ06667.1 helix-turn-helix domain-containing protein [Hymenobacter busanensis]
MTLQEPADYRAALRRLDALVAAGFEGNPELEAEFRELIVAIDTYEDKLGLLPIPNLPTTLADMIELKRQQMRLKQKDLAQLLEVPAGRLSQILSGKRRVTLDLAKKLYERLGISPEFILKTA